MVAWKDAFEKINVELETTKRKKQALEDLLNSNRISQPTFDIICKDLDEDINEVELRRKALAQKMASKLNDLEKQLQTLEFFLAYSEMAYVAGEVNSDLYSQESTALNMGMEATKQELNWIKEVIIELIPKENTPTTTATVPTTVETVEATPTETAVENAPQVSASVPIEAPVQVAVVTAETAAQQSSQATTETTTAEPTTEGGQAPFRGQGENPPAQQEKTEG